MYKVEFDPNCRAELSGIPALHRNIIYFHLAHLRNYPRNTTWSLCKGGAYYETNLPRWLFDDPVIYKMSFVLDDAPKPPVLIVVRLDIEVTSGAERDR